MLPIDQRKKILELRSKGMSLMQIRDMIKELYGREKLSVATCWNIINGQSHITEADEEAVVDKMIDANYGSLLERKYSQQKEKMFKRALLYQQSADLIINKFKEEVLNNVKPIELNINDKDISNPDLSHTIYVISDLHYGRQTDALIENFGNLLEEILRDGKQIIDIVCLGDLFETPIITGMHSDQLLDLEVVGVKQVLECMDMIIGGIALLIGKGYLVRNFVVVSGNHDRISKNRNEDPEKIIMVLAMEYLKAKIGYAVNVDFGNKALLTKQLYGCNFILHHGDNGFIQKPDVQILQTYGRMDMFNIIISGHTHTADLVQGTNYIRMRSPALCQPGRYEKDQYIGASNPGFARIDIDKGVPSVSFKLLPFISK